MNISCVCYIKSAKGKKNLVGGTRVMTDRASILAWWTLIGGAVM